jgi:hypothetical protein
MRILEIEVPEGAQCTPFANTAQILLERQLSPPHLGLSLKILTVMTFPDDPERQNAFYAAFEMGYLSPAEEAGQSPNGPDRESAGKFFLDLMNADIAASQSRWQNAGDQLLLLLRMIATDDISTEEASLSKARHLLETTEAPNRQRLETDWSMSKSVAPLAAAACFLVQRAIDTAGPKTALNLIAAIFADPVTLLCIARRIQEKCLEFVPRGSREPVLSPETLWRVPSKFPPLPIEFKPLLPQHLNELSTYRGRRGTRTAATYVCF